MAFAEEEKDNGTLLTMEKLFEVSEKFYQRARFCGGQVSRIYGLAEVHKKDVPLHLI